MDILVKKLHPDAKLPTRAHPVIDGTGDAGFDVYILEEVIIPPGDIVKARTGIAIQIPPGWWGRVKERSNVALKDMVETKAGVIDNGYRGELILGLHNMSQKMWAKYEAGAKVAQLIPIPLYMHGDIIEVDELDESTRGCGGFGSTGR